MAVIARKRVTPKEFGARLRILREAAGLSQAELARLTGLKKQSIASWEIGHRTANFIDVIKVAAVLGKDVDDFAEPPPSVPDPILGRPKKKPDDTE